MIERYEFGLILIDGKEYKDDVVIRPGEILAKEWFREEGHNLRLIDIKDYLNNETDFVVIGTGDGGEMKVSDEVMDFLKEKGIEVFVDETSKAVEEYNKLEKEGREVVGFLYIY